MDDHTESKNGLSLTDAWHRLTDRDLYREYQEAVEAVKEAAAPADPPIGGYFSYSKRERAKRANEEKDALAALTQDLKKKWIDGQLVFTGRLADGEGNAITTHREKIPVDVAESNKFRFNWNGRVSGDGMRFVSVRVYLASEAPGAEKALSGKPLSEWYKRFVIDDEERRRLLAECEIWHPEWADILESEIPGSAVVSLDQYDREVSNFPSYLSVPVRFEKWASPRNECFLEGRGQRIFFPDDELPDDEPPGVPNDVPDEVVALHLRRQELTKALLVKFRDRSLVLKGVREDPESLRDYEPEKIPERLISRHGVTMAFNGNILFVKVRGAPRPVIGFTDLRVFLPEDAAAGSGDAATLSTASGPGTLESGEGAPAPPAQKRKTGPKGGQVGSRQLANTTLSELVKSGEIDPATTSQTEAARLVRDKAFPEWDKRGIQKHIKDKFNKMKEAALAKAAKEKAAKSQ